MERANNIYKAGERNKRYRSINSGLRLIERRYVNPKGSAIQKNNTKPDETGNLLRGSSSITKPLSFFKK